MRAEQAHAGPTWRAALALAASALLAAGCSAFSATTAPAAQPTALRRSYERAVEAAAIYEEHWERSLEVPRGDPVRVVAWTRHAYERGPTRLGKEIWVTLDGEVRSRCRDFGGDVALRLLQLLGLAYPDAGGEPRRFVELEVARSDLFRPCPDPSIDADRCGNDLPSHVPHAHVRWFAGNTLASQQLPRGYPWTRLGYTYDWKPGGDRYGVTEFVVRYGAEIHVVRITKTNAYCAPSS